MITELEKNAAYVAGRHAAQANLPLSSCPYTAADDPGQQILTLWYIRGFRSDNEPVDQPADLGEGE